MKTKTIFIILLGVNASAFAAERANNISPDQQFVARCVSRNPDETGSRLIVSAVGKESLGVLIRENDRWIEAKWSPDSKFLAITDGSDGHVSDIFIYRIQRSDVSNTKTTYISFPAFGEIADSAHASGIRAELWYHTPNVWSYDTRWEFAGWSHDSRSFTITKHARREKDTTITVNLKPPADPKKE